MIRYFLATLVVGMASTAIACPPVNVIAPVAQPLAVQSYAVPSVQVQAAGVQVLAAPAYSYAAFAVPTVQVLAAPVCVSGHCGGVRVQAFGGVRQRFFSRPARSRVRVRVNSF